MKGKRLVRNILIAAAGLTVLLFIILQTVLNSRVLTPLVNRIAAEYVEGELDFSRIHASVFRSFPYLNVRIEDGTLTYPHDRYARFDSLFTENGRRPLLQAGRAPGADTLASFRRLEASLHFLAALRGIYDLHHVSLSRPRIFAHYYDSTAANWDILPLESHPEDTSSSPPPPFRLHSIRLEDQPLIVFTDQADTLMGLITLRRLDFKGHLDLSDLPSARAEIGIDSMLVNGRLPNDTLSAGIDRLRVRAENRKISLDASAQARLATRSFGRLALPLRLSAEGALPQREDNALEIRVDTLRLSLASLDLGASGQGILYPEKTYLRADASIRDCTLNELIRTYQDNFPILKKFRTDAVLSLDAGCDGYLAEGTLPAGHARLTIPASSLDYDGFGRKGRIALDAEAATDEKLRLDVDLRRFLMDIAGARLDVSGTVSDLTGEDPAFLVIGDLHARVDSLTRAFTRERGIDGTGTVDGSVEGMVFLSQLSMARIGESDIRSHFQIRDLAVNDEADKLTAYLPRADIALWTQGNEIDDSMRKGARILSLEASADSINATFRQSMYIRGKDLKIKAQNAAELLKGGKELTPLMGVIEARHLSVKDQDSLSVNVLGNTETFRIIPSNQDFRSPKLSLTSRSRGVHLRQGQETAALTDFRFDISAHKHLAPAPSSRDTLRRGRRERPSRTRERDFREKDIHISLGESLTGYYRDWDFSGGIALSQARLTTPAFPLRSSISAVKGSVSNDRIDLDNITFRAGVSDLTAQGSLSGLRRALLTPGAGRLKLDAKVSSKRLDINELLRAIAFFTSYNPDPSMDKATTAELQMAADTAQLPDSVGTQLVVIPGNLEATVGLEANRIDYDSLCINWASADFALRRRTLQVTEGLAMSNMGDIYFEGFYSTRSKKDLKAGFNLNLVDITAEKVITLFPAVDTLMPMLKSFAGDLDCTLSATSQVDTAMNLILPTIDGVMRITGKDLSIDNDSPEFRKIASLLRFRDRNKVRVDQMSVSGMIRDNTLEIFPFVLDIDRYVLAASGLQHFDESFQYHLSLIKSPLLVKFGVNIWGPGFGDIHYGVGKARYRNTQVPAFTRQLDTIQLNLLASIHNIFEIGVERAMAENRSLRLVEERMEAMGFSEAEPPVETSEGVPAQDASWMEPIRSHAAQRREAIREEVLEAIENEGHE
ncbi:MAG: hypothetical protein J5939_06835 [Bacteroidales bacterium]|nr:hypothetical protein [Bacteroidales bacterium]